MSPFKVLVISGPTAVGKTELSLKLAEAFQGEIISADSRQFFMELNIGTAKPGLDELKRVPHHFVNSHSIADEYSAGKFEKEGLATVHEIDSRGKLPIIVGGSGLYIDALIHGIDQPPSDPELRDSLNETLENHGLVQLQERLKSLDPEKYEAIDLNNPRRVLRAVEIAELEKRGITKPLKKPGRNFESIIIVLNRDRTELYERINTRVDQMIENGLVEEVEELLPFRQMQAMQTVGYRELASYFDKQLSFEEAVNLIKQNTRRYAKRQITWFKRMKSAHWFHPAEQNKIIHFVKSSLEKRL